MITPGFWRRMGGALYEALAVLALWMLASAIVTTLHDNATHGWARALLQELSLVLVAAYFLWCWTRGGQTLAMKTWKMRLISRDGTGLGLLQALQRLGLAALFTLAGGIGFWWALIDKDRQFLHDRLSGTRIVLAESKH
jgi:uncharacterized RDD family membrane protein YckC